MDEFILPIIEEKSTNDFELREKIGSGGTRIVLKAMWKSENMMVAAKNIHVKNIPKEVSVVKCSMLHPLNGLLLFQVAIIKSLRHKNIVHSYGLYNNCQKLFDLILGLFKTISFSLKHYFKF